MRSLNLWGGSLFLAAIFASGAGIASAQSDNPSASLSLDPDEVVQVVYAVYGGVTDDKTASHYVNVTDKVVDLLKNSSTGFAVTGKGLLGKEEPDLVQSLIVIYNYDQQSYFYNIAEGGGNVSLDTLRSWAKAHRTSLIGAPIDAPNGDDFHVVFAAYGVGDTFLNVTDQMRKLLHDQPDGFMATEANMGGDPHPGWGKESIVIFDDSSGRHLYSLLDVGPHISKDSILAGKAN
jgi:hypothetical protein